jgi:hypothetical protein
VNTSLTTIALNHNHIDDDSEIIDSADALTARNKRFRDLFLFDARRMLLSLMCADECGVVWPYLLESGKIDEGVARFDCITNFESIRAELFSVIAERDHRRRQNN